MEINQNRPPFLTDTLKRKSITYQKSLELIRIAYSYF